MATRAESSARAKQRSAKGKLMRKATSSPLTRKQQREMNALRRLPNASIDTTHVPEVTDWSGARRGLFYRPLKQQLTLRLDADVVEWFKTHEGGNAGYQTRINQALREYVKRQKRRIA
jgi:uncharacterized protein (DUF4415 family)